MNPLESKTCVICQEPLSVSRLFKEILENLEEQREGSEENKIEGEVFALRVFDQADRATSPNQNSNHSNFRSHEEKGEENLAAREVNGETDLPQSPKLQTEDSLEGENVSMRSEGKWHRRK